MGFVVFSMQLNKPIFLKQQHRKFQDRGIFISYGTYSKRSKYFDLISMINDSILILPSFSIFVVVDQTLIQTLKRQL